MKGMDPFIKSKGEIKMLVRDLMALLLHADQDAEVSYAFMVSSESGEYLEGDGSLDADHISVEHDHVVFHVFD